MTTQSTPVWRSLLFIPANNEKFVAKAHTRGADGIILDLEDSIAADQKATARTTLERAAGNIADNGCDVLVRVNAELLEEDIPAAAAPAVSAIVLPKVESAATICHVARMLDQLEHKKDITAGKIRLIAQIEDVRALPELDNIATASSRLLGMSLGSEDFSASAGMLPQPDTLYGPNQQVAFACRRANILPFGFPDSITLFEDLSALKNAVERAASMGLVGAFCIHPKQVDVINRAFTPDHERVTDAKAILKAFDAAKHEGKAVFSHNGKMVDLPVVLRARELVARADSIAAKS